MGVRPINLISLCSGGAGLDLGVELALPGVRPICYVEREAFAIEFLASRMEAKCLAPAPIWSDLRSFDGKPWRGVVDILTAGYPCQPFSFAGQRRGSDDPRHLWPDIARIARECEPGILFLENVSGHLSMGFREVSEECERMGYSIAAGLFTAAEVGGSHERERLFILAVADPGSLRYPGNQRGGSPRKEPRRPLPFRPATEFRPFLFPPGPGDAASWVEILKRSPDLSPALAYARRRRRPCGDELLQASTEDHRNQRREQPDRGGSPGDDHRREDAEISALESRVRRMVDGVGPYRSHWLRLLGNGVVPLQAAYAFTSLWAVIRERYAS